MRNKQKLDPRTAPKRMRKLDSVTVLRVRCPRCDGSKLLKYRSIRDQGDGSSVAWVKCQGAECGWRFKVVME